VVEPDEEAAKRMEEEISMIIYESENKKKQDKKGINSFEDYLSLKPTSPPPKLPRRRLYESDDEDDIFRPSTKVSVYVEDDEDSYKTDRTQSATRLFDDFESDIKDEGRINEIHDEVINIGAIIHNLCSQITKNNKIINDKLDKMNIKITSLNDKIDNIEKRFDDVQIEMEQGIALIEKKCSTHQRHHPEFA
jgi:hypothetical protein